MFLGVKDSITALLKHSSVFSSKCLLVTVTRGRHQIATDCAWEAGTCATAESFMTKINGHKNLPKRLVQACIQLAIAFFVGGAAWPVGVQLEIAIEKE